MTRRCARPSSTSPTTTSGWPRARRRPRWKRSSGSTTASTASTTAQSCAAFASLTLELGAQVVGQQSWVTRRLLLPVAAARVGRCPRQPESGLARRSLDPAGRAGASPLAPAGRRLPAAARRLGGFRRPRRGGHQVRRRRAAHDRRRLAAQLLGQRPRVSRARSPARESSASSTTVRCPARARHKARAARGDRRRQRASRPRRQAGAARRPAGAPAPAQRLRPRLPGRRGAGAWPPSPGWRARPARPSSPGCRSWLTGLSARAAKAPSAAHYRRHNPSPAAGAGA